MPASPGRIMTSFFVALLTLGIGLIIGYYKARADFTKVLQDYLSKDDCDDCTLKVEVQNVAKENEKTEQDLQRGRDMFRKLELSLAEIKVHLGIKSDQETLKAVIAALKAKDYIQE